MRVIGITGRNCAGKDSVADVLVELGFARHSLSDALRDELRRRGTPITRENLIRAGNDLRHAEGPAVLAERMKGLMHGEDRVALVSIRNPREVEALRDLGGFVLIGVDAPTAVRFERERDRNRESAVETLEAFEALEAQENTSDPEAQQLDETFALADEVILNDATLEDLHARVLAFLETLDG